MLDTAAGVTARHDDVVIGVLAMQGAFREHVQVLHTLGVEAVEVRTLAHLASVDGLVIPGGESTTIRKMLVNSGLYEALAGRLAEGMPAFGTCAGMIVLARSARDGAPATYGLLDVQVERNGFGRQLYSFEADVLLEHAAHTARHEAETESLRARMPGVFIRAPRIEAVGDGVEVIGRLAGGEAVAVRQGALLACTFHPELSGAVELHEIFVEQCRSRRRRARRPSGGAVG